MRLWETAIQFPKCHSIRLEARAEISGPPIRYLTPGSALRLQCRVVQNTEASEYIFWYHDNRMINYDIDRGINVSTEPGKSAPLPPHPQLNLTTLHCILAFHSFLLQTFNHRSLRFSALVASIRAISPAWRATRSRRVYWCIFSKVSATQIPQIPHAYRVIRLHTLRILAACQRGHLKYCALVNCSDQIKEKKGE